MKCWFCDKDAKGTCAACGRGLCADHAHFHDELMLAKSDTSTGYAASITFTMRSNVRIVVWNGSTIGQATNRIQKAHKNSCAFCDPTLCPLWFVRKFFVFMQVSTPSVFPSSQRRGSAHG